MMQRLTVLFVQHDHWDRVFEQIRGVDETSRLGARVMGISW